MVEFALLAGLLFLMVMGIFDFGRAISVYINIAEAAHEGARQLVLRSNYASTPPDSVIINATLAKIGGGGMVLKEDPCLFNPTPCTSPSFSGMAPNTGYIWISPNRTPWDASWMRTLPAPSATVRRSEPFSTERTTRRAPKRRARSSAATRAAASWSRSPVAWRSSRSRAFRVCCSALTRSGSDFGGWPVAEK